MIITRDLLLAVGGCNTIVDQLINEGYFNLTRLQFINKLQQDSDAGIYPSWWVNWGKQYLYIGDAIFHNGEFVRTNRYDIQGMNIDLNNRMFNTLQEAELVLKQKRDEYNASEDSEFYVQALCLEGVDAHTLHNCDLDGDGIFDHDIQCYRTFNHKIAEYETFDTFEKAKIRCQELRAQRIAEIDASYYILEEIQQINDPEENPKGWIFLKKFTDIIY